MSFFPMVAFLFMLGAAVPKEYRLTDPPFSAIPDDGISDAPALQSALEQMVADGYATLIIPPGQYDIDTRVTVEGDFRYMRIEGRGHNITRLFGNNGSGVLRIVATSPDAVLEIVDLDVVPAQPGAGTGLELFKPYSEPEQADYNLLLEGLEMRCNNRLTDYFDRTIVADGWMPLVDNVAASGPFGPDVTEEDRRRAESSLVLTNVFRPRIDRCYFWSARKGIAIHLTDAHAEPTINGTVSVQTGEGIRISKSGSRPLSAPVRVVNTHWNNNQFGLRLENLDAFSVVDSVPYFETPEGSAPDYGDLELVNCSNGVVEDNLFWYGASFRPLIRLDAACRNVSIRHNHFAWGTSTRPVTYEAGAQDILVEDNIYGTVFANDEAGTFGLWNMDTNASGQVVDIVSLGAGRNNALVLSGGAVSRFEGYDPPDLRPALFFDTTAAQAESSNAWNSSAGIRISLFLLPAAPDVGTVLDIPGVCSMDLTGSSLVFSFTRSGGEQETLQVDGIYSSTYWRQIRAEVNPSTGFAVLEVDGIGADRRHIVPLGLAPVSAPLRLSPSSFTGAIDQLWIRTLEKQAEQTDAALHRNINR